MINPHKLNINFWKYLVPYQIKSGLKTKQHHNKLTVSSYKGLFDWNKIQFHLRRQSHFIEGSLRTGGYLYIVTNNKKLGLFIETLARKIGVPVLVGPWKGSMLTNQLNRFGLPIHILVTSLDFCRGFINETLLTGVPVTFLVNDFNIRQKIGVCSVLPFNTLNTKMLAVACALMAYSSCKQTKFLNKMLYFTPKIILTRHPSFLKEMKTRNKLEFTLQARIYHKVMLRKNTILWTQNCIQLPQNKIYGKQLKRKSLLPPKKNIRLSSWYGINTYKRIVWKKFRTTENLVKS